MSEDEVGQTADLKAEIDAVGSSMVLAVMC